MVTKLKLMDAPNSLKRSLEDVGYKFAIQAALYPGPLAAAVGLLGHELVRVVMAVIDSHSGAKIMLTGPIANRIVTPMLITTYGWERPLNL
jgi:hypothetical protein